MVSSRTSDRRPSSQRGLALSGSSRGLLGAQPCSSLGKAIGRGTSPSTSWKGAACAGLWTVAMTSGSTCARRCATLRAFPSPRLRALLPFRARRRSHTPHTTPIATGGRDTRALFPGARRSIALARSRACTTHGGGGALEGGRGEVNSSFARRHAHRVQTGREPSASRRPRPKREPGVRARGERTPEDGELVVAIEPRRRGPRRRGGAARGSVVAGGRSRADS